MPSTFSVLMVGQRKQISSVLLSHCLSVEILEHAACHDDLLTVFSHLLNLILTKIQSCKTSHSRQQGQNLLLQVRDPVAFQIKSLDSIAVVKRLAVDDLAIS